MACVHVKHFYQQFFNWKNACGLKFDRKKGHKRRRIEVSSHVTEHAYYHFRPDGDRAEERDTNERKDKITMFWNSYSGKLVYQSEIYLFFYHRTLISS